MTNNSLEQTIKEYCTWAYNETYAYYNKLLTIDKDNPHINLRIQQGQLIWTIEEIAMWNTLLGEQPD